MHFLSNLICWITLTTVVYAIKSQRTFKPPSFISSVTLKVKGEDECVRTSQYAKPEKGYTCKDMGQCYKYRCGAIARHCSECGERKGPCIDYSAQENIARDKRSLKKETMTSHANFDSFVTDFMTTFKEKMSNMMAKIKTVVKADPSPGLQRIETIGNAIVHIRAGHTNCAGFVTSISGNEQEKYLILTAAQCLINFEVECSSGKNTFGDKFKANVTSGKMVDGYMTYDYAHSQPCFGDYDADISKVKKGFRSYAVVVTSYAGKNFTIPLDSKNVIVPREYMECQDCRNDFAAIPINGVIASIILRGKKPFILAPDRDPMDWTGEEVPQFVAVQSNYPPDRMYRAADTKLCTISYSTKHKMCFKLPIPPNVDENPELMPGSPLFLPIINSEGDLEYHCIGIFTGTHNVASEKLSTDELSEDGIKPTPTGTKVSLQLKYSKNGAVRITQNIVTFLETFCEDPVMNVTVAGNGSRIVPLFYPKRRECFPNIASPLKAEDHLFLCSLGWKDEGSRCDRPDVKLSERCAWDGSEFVCERRMRRSTHQNHDSQYSIFQEIVIPGTTRRLELRGHHISNEVELTAVLSRLPMLQDLILDYNDIEILTPPMFNNNTELQMLSLKHNKIRKINGATFWFNRKLQYLNLGNNHIKALPGDLLHKTMALHHLNLANNNIRYIPPKFLIRTTELKKLYLGSNNITYLAQNLFHHLTDLNEIWMEENTILRLSKYVFHRCPALSLIDLSHNRIIAVSRNAFDWNNKLMSVNLNYNNLTEIPKRLFTNHKKLASFRASKNPLTAPQKTKQYYAAVGVPYF